MFIDQSVIYVKGGNGGKGCRSFYRDKYKREGIPDGGDGGKGADIIFCADRNLCTLLDFQYNRHFYGHKGHDGSGKKRKGKDAAPVRIKVPVGTIVKDVSNDCLLRELTHDGDEFIVARGGKGGRGNDILHHQASLPEAGEERKILLDLKLIADAGIIGFPNAGKSTLISAISNAHPKIAPYPFTTKSPVLGVIRVQDKSFVVADIPGLIHGSSSGRGLGDRFLRHTERSRVLIHLIDMSGTEGRDPVEDYRAINKELLLYSGELAKKIQIIAANKMDMAEAKTNLVKFRRVVKKKIYPISALQKEGLDELLQAVAKRI